MPASDETPTPVPQAGAVGPVPAGIDGERTVISRGVAAVPLPAAGPASATEIGRALEGTTLGAYRLEQFVGGGGMGAVFRALDTTLDRIVAVKVLARHQSADEEMLRRFRNEAQSAARLDHENIGRVHAVGSEGGWHFIVFEFIEGRNVRDLVREQGPFDVARTIDVAIQVADALEHASQRDVVHRDIKPSNIVITPAGRARVVDMGLARLHQMADEGDLTLSGMTLGTFDYISPEQARDPREADVRSDLYSLGCTMFFMLAGRAPFAAGTMVQKLLQHQQAEAPAIDELRPEVPRRLAAALQRLMAKDPADRFQHPADLAAELADIAEAERIPLATPRPVAAPVPIAPAPRAARPSWLVPIMGLALVVGALWLRSVADRREAEREPAAAPTGGAAAPPLRPDLVRVVAAPVAADEVATIAEGIARVADGGTVELDWDGEREEPPVALGGRTLLVRAAPGRRPAVAVRLPPDEGGAAWDVGAGRIEIRGIDLRLAAPLPAAAALFAVTAGALSVADAAWSIPGNPARDDDVAPATRAAFVSLALPAGTATTATIELADVQASGDAVFLEAGPGGGGSVTLRWSGGGCRSPRRLLVAEGTSGADPLAIDCVIEGLDVACREGIVLLRDAPGQATPPRLRVSASDCRLVVTAPGRPFLEQSGIGEPETYAEACRWTDDGSRYGGSDVFRRVDGAAERVETGFADLPTALRRAAGAGADPDAG